MINIKTIIQGIFISLAVWLIMYLILDFSNINKSNLSLYPQNRHGVYENLSLSKRPNNSFLSNFRITGQKASNERIRNLNNNISGLIKNEAENSNISEVGYNYSRKINFSNPEIIANNNDNLYDSDYRFSKNKRNPRKNYESQFQALNIGVSANGLNLGFLQKDLIAKNDNLLNQSDLTSDNQLSKVDENPGEPDYGTVPVGNGLWLLLSGILFYLLVKLNFIRFLKNKS